MNRAPMTARGTRTRDAILAAAEVVFARSGYADASITKITAEANVAQGTFYNYFESKLEVFEELVEDLNRRVRHAMTEATAGAQTRIEQERAGFRAFFEFTRTHPALYRVVREAEFVSPRSLRLHYTRIVEGYVKNLTAARASGEVGDLDPTVTAWALMGIGELAGMRWVLWGDGLERLGDQGDHAGTGIAADGSSTDTMPDDVFEQLMELIRRALAPPADAQNGRAR